MSEITAERIAHLLDLDLGPNDSGAATVRGYLVRLVEEVWRLDEMFSGKRPFGTSGWQHDFYGPMIKAGIITGTLDEDGYIETADTKAGDALVLAAITSLGQPAPASTGDGQQPSVVGIEMHRWYAVIHNSGGEVVAVIGHTDDGLARYESVDAWDAAQPPPASTGDGQQAAEAERDKAYRERAALVAYLAAVYPSVMLTDAAEPDWPIVFISTPSGQMSWHIAKADLELFAHVPATTEPTWDGHTTEVKYERLAELTRTVAASDGDPDACDAAAVGPVAGTPEFDAETARLLAETGNKRQAAARDGFARRAREARANGGGDDEHR